MKTTARRASSRPKRKSSVAGTTLRNRIRSTRNKKTKLYSIPRLYWQTLVLSIVLFSIALLTRWYNPGTTLTPGPITNTSSAENDYSFVIPEAPDLDAPQSWTLSDEPILRGITNVSSIVYPDGTIALYYVQDGNIYRRTSQDGVEFGDPESTGISEDTSIPFDRRPEIHNPAVLQISSEYFIMVYELSPRQKIEVPQIDQPRAFYVAFSSDGLRFSQHGKIVDGARNDAGLLSSPDLLLLPNGNLRMVYESQGDRIVSMLSENVGQDWIWEGERIAATVYDPALHYLGEDYILYYAAPRSDISQDGNIVQSLAIFQAESSDGLTFTKTNQAVLLGPNNRSIRQPEVITQSDGSVRMYVEVLREGTTDVYDLYTALGK